MKISNEKILVIEPSRASSDTPLIDELTLKMTAAWRRRQDSKYYYPGFHTCVCGVCSDNKDHWINDDRGIPILTNSLCIHYLAFHRDDVPQEDLERIRSFTYGEEEPSEIELSKPKNS